MLLLLLSAWAAYVSTCNAFYESFYFSNASCPGFGFNCMAPENICAYDSTLNKYYCCSGLEYPLCRAARQSQCTGTNGQPSESQIQCTDGDTEWCCLSDSERCTQRTGQFNICISTSTNPLANISGAVINETYSSLSSARPSATSLALDVAQLTASSTSSSSSSAASTASSTASSPSSTTTSASASNDSSSGLSGGAIAGIVIGAIAVIALGAAALFIMKKRRSRRDQAPAAVASHLLSEKNDHPPTYGYYKSEQGGDGRSEAPRELPNSERSELWATSEPMELEGSTRRD